MSARAQIMEMDDDLLRNGAIAEAILVHMDFADTPRWWWSGFGDLEADGVLWQGLGDLIAVSGLTSTYQLSADQITFQIAADEEMIDLAVNAIGRVLGRAVSVKSQWFATQNIGDVGAWQPVGPPFSIFTGIMKKMPISFSGPQAEISLVCEGLFVDRNAAPHGLLTDADQKNRFANDRGLELVSKYVGYETRWI